MAFLLAPRFAPAYAPQCNSWSCAPVRPSYSYRHVSRPSFPIFAPFLSQFDELLTELDREARRQRQQRKRIVRAHFNVHENNEQYQIDGEVPGFKQENIEIEVTDENTLRVVGNNATQKEPSQTEDKTSDATTAEQEFQNEEKVVTLDQPTQSASGAATPTHSDTESHKSYQATVEDDFEDLGAEIASALSASSNNATEPHHSKGKERAVDEPTDASLNAAAQPQPQSESPAQQPQSIDGEEGAPQLSFERTFRFPERIDSAHVVASLRNGLLSITVPKAKAPETRRVLIQ